MKKSKCRQKNGIDSCIGTGRPEYDEGRAQRAEAQRSFPEMGTAACKAAQESEKAWGDILQSGNFKSTNSFIQHGSVSVHSHSIRVAECSLKLEKFLEKLGIHCHERDLVRGALLHDYFLYDWHDKYSHEKLHGFHHPYVALENASREYQLTPRERDIIRKHMWPLTLFHIPRCREAWVVTTADKYCSLKETLLERKGRNKNRKKSENNDAEDTC